MKTKSCLNLPATARALFLAALTGASCRALAQDPADTNSPAQTAVTTTTAEPAATNTPVAETPTPTPTPAATVQAAAPASNTVASTASGAKTNGIDLNYNNAPIDLVLKYLSEAAGLIIVQETRVSGYITVMGRNLTRDEALNLLFSALDKNGFAAVRSGDRTIRIMAKGDVIHSKNPVRTGNALKDIPDNDEMATWIIPIQFVEASQLMSDINPFVNSQATIIANQAGNSLIITDIQSNIRHLVEIIKAIDSSAEDVTEVRVWKLTYADPTETATELMNLFQDQNNGASTPVQFGGRGGRGGGGGGRGGIGGFGGFGGAFNPFAGFGGGQNAGGNSQQSRVKKRNQLVAVADPRTTSIAVLATKDLLDQIDSMIKDLDQPGKHMIVTVIPVNNGNAPDVLQALQDTVGATSSRNNRNNSQTDALTSRIQTGIQNMNNNNNVFGGNSGAGGGRRGGTGVGGF
jgi:type II secretory pathway component GspD/PulD (secretin)